MLLGKPRNCISHFPGPLGGFKAPIRPLGRCGELIQINGGRDGMYSAECAQSVVYGPTNAVVGESLELNTQRRVERSRGLDESEFRITEYIFSFHLLWNSPEEVGRKGVGI